MYFWTERDGLKVENMKWCYKLSSTSQISLYNFLFVENICTERTNLTKSKFEYKLGFDLMLNVRYASIYHKIFTCLLSRLNKTNCVVLKAYFNDLRLLNFPIGLSVWNDVSHSLQIIIIFLNQTLSKSHKQSTKSSI